jgi:hypothetical protein
MTRKVRYVLSTALGALPLSVAVTMAGCSSCAKSSAPAAVVDSGPTPAQLARTKPPPSSSQRPHREMPPPPADAPPLPKNLPTWVLSPDDPARDYVDRYIRSTLRYGPQTATCVVVQKSVFSGGHTTVDVKNDESGSCGAATQLRDTFQVDVGADRLSVVDPDKHDPLRKWPDGSDPEGPAGMAIEKEPHSWKAPLKDAFEHLDLVPVRLQWYGRGTYPIITLAGWHGELNRDAGPSTLQEFAQKLCPANDNRPFAVFAGIDRANILRFDCPDKVRWELL